MGAQGSGSARRRAIRVAIALIVGALTACSTGGPADRAPSAGVRPTSGKRTPIHVEGDVFVREVSKEDPTPILCDRGDVPNDSTCNGVPAIGVDWDRLRPHDQLGPDEVNAAFAQLSGIYDGAVVTISSISSISTIGVGRSPDPSAIEPRCVEPSEGWASQRGDAISWAQWDDLVQSLAGDPAVLSFAFAPFDDFTDYSDNGGAPAATFLPTIDWPLTAHTVLVVYVDAELDRYRTDLASRFNGPICVLASSRSPHAASDAQRILTNSDAIAAGVDLIRIDAPRRGILFIRLAVIDDEIAAWVAEHLGDTRTGVWITPLLAIVS